MLSRKLPIPVTINDCELLYQMGYCTELSNGKVSKVSKIKKK